MPASARCLVGPLLSRALAFRLGAGHGALDAGEQPAVVGAQVGVAAHGGQREVLLVGQVDEVLELARLTVEPVEVPGHHRVDAAARMSASIRW